MFFFYASTKTGLGMPRLTNINFGLDDDDEDGASGLGGEGAEGGGDEDGLDRDQQQKSAEEIFEAVCSQRLGDMPSGGRYFTEKKVAHFIFYIFLFFPPLFKITDEDTDDLWASRTKEIEFGPNIGATSPGSAVQRTSSGKEHSLDI